MAWALRLVFFLAAVGGMIAFVYIYRRKANQIVAIVLISYAIGTGSRLLNARDDDEIVRTSVLALIGLAVVYGVAWGATHYIEKRGWRLDD